MKFIPRNFSILHSWKKPPVNPIVLDKVVLQAKEFLHANYLVKNDDPFSIPSTLSSSSPSSLVLALFNNQADVIQAWMTKLKGSQHPIVNLAKDFCRDSFPVEKQSNGNEIDMGSSSTTALSSLSMQLRAIIILLVSKSIGFPSAFPPVKIPLNERQQTLADIAELMHAAYILHQTVVDVPKFEDVVNYTSYQHQNEQNSGSSSSIILEKEVAEKGEMAREISRPTTPSNEVLTKDLSLIQQGNNLAALMGDLLLAKTSRGLSTIKNSRVTELMSDSISDFAESEFVVMNSMVEEPEQQQQKQQQQQKIINNVVIDNSLRSINRHTWLRKNQLGIGSLLGRACYCSVLLSGHDESVRQLGYRLGEKLGLLLQASKEISFFLQEEQETPVIDLGVVVLGKRNIPLHFDLCTLPVINALELQTISLDRLQILKNNFFYGYSQIYHEIQLTQNEQSVERLKEALCNLQDDCMKIVRQLPQSKLDSQSEPPKEATRLLTDIIHSLSPL